MKKIIDMLKSMTNSKKKVFALALATCVIVLSIASSSIAYFTDTDEYTNAFTSGNVKINLLVEGEDVTDKASEPDFKDAVIPGKTVEKTTVIKNVGTESAYIGAVITLAIPDAADFNISTIITESGDSDDNIPVAVATLLNGLVSNGTDYTVKIVSENKLITIYIAKNVAVAANGEVQLFDKIIVPTTWDNAEMDKFEQVTIDVKAYAVQSEGIGAANAYAALQTGFGTDIFPN